MSAACPHSQTRRYILITGGVCLLTDRDRGPHQSDDGKEDAWKEYSTKTKFKKFKDRLIEEGHSKPEIEMLLAAVSVLRNNRNIGSHPLMGLPGDEIEKKSLETMKQINEFQRLAKKYKRPLWPSVVFSSQVYHHTAIRWDYSIARMAIIWLEEYSKLPAESCMVD